MTRFRIVPVVLAMFVSSATVTGSWAVAQVAEAAPAQTAAASTPAEPGAPETAPAGAQPALASPSATPGEAQHKGKKEEYTGPNTVVELPPTPMLDEEGKQRLDPDGKPMFNTPVRQQRDKKGHPLFNDEGKPVMQTASELGYDEHGKKLHADKAKASRMTPVSISRGTFSVDGMTGKAALNYDIPDFKYLYLFAPGVGIAVVSNEAFPGATEQGKAFDGKLLTVKVGDHVLQLASDKPFLGKDVKPGYVLLDRQFTLPSAAPVVGYGTLRKAPYAWPGAKPNAAIAGVDAPPVPTAMLPTQLLKPCPAGQMRRPAPKALPGQPVPDQPCIAISSVKKASPEVLQTDAKFAAPQL